MQVTRNLVSTTHIDLHGDKLKRDDLAGFVEQARLSIKPILIEHNFDRQIGIILDARVHELSDGEFGLFVLCGLFEDEDEKVQAHHLNGSLNTFWSEMSQLLDDIPAEDKLVCFSEPLDLPKDNGVEARLCRFLDSTSVWVDGSVYKIKRFIASVGDLFIHVYHDHDPPHFHVKSRQRKIDARFGLDSLEPLDKDAISTRDAKRIKAFFEGDPLSLQKLNEEHARMQSEDGRS